MRQSLFLGATAIVFVGAAVAMIAAAVLAQPAPVTSPSTQSADAAADVARRFYAAVNAAIATGDAAPLRTVVAPHFADESPLPGVRAGRDGLEEYLAALHATSPGTRLMVEEAVAADDRVVAQVRTAGTEPQGALRGFLVDQPPLWGTVDVLRVADGVVVEHWGQSDDLALPRPLAEVGLDLPTPAPRVVTLERLTMRHGATWQAPPAGARLLYLEAGALRIDMAVPEDATASVAGSATGASMPNAASSEPVMLSPGRSLLVPGDVRRAATNVGAGEVRLLVATFSVPRIPNGDSLDSEQLPSGVTRQILAGDLATRTGVGTATLALDRLSLARRARLSMSSGQGPVLLAVETGRLGAAVWGTAWMRRGADGVSVQRGSGDLTAGDGLLLHPGGLVAVQNAGDGPSDVLVLTLRPEPAPTSTQPA
jgi:predicted SnoaL-like aldol condensation-catalyzing enzyme